MTVECLIMKALIMNDILEKSIATCELIIDLKKPQDTINDHFTIQLKMCPQNVPFMCLLLALPERAGNFYYLQSQKILSIFFQASFPVCD